MKYLLATYILTDGSLTRKGDHYRLEFSTKDEVRLEFSTKDEVRLEFSTKDEVLRDIIYTMLFNESKYLPLVNRDKKGVYGIKVTDISLAKRLLKLNPSYKKIPSKGQKVEDYFSKQQPSLNFLKKADKKTKEWCVRLALSTDGYISLSERNVITLALSCYHPSLCKEWSEIFELCGMKAHPIKRKDSWCGYHGVRISTKDLKVFWKMGGFVQGVKISKKSKKYKGLENNILLKRAIDSRRARSLAWLEHIGFFEQKLS